jgi:hypothetical protein
MNTVKFYRRDTGALKRVKIRQSWGPHDRGDRIYYPARITEAMMAALGYSRKRPRGLR